MVMGLMHFWQQGDGVSHAVAILLALLSLLSWSVIGTRFIAQLKVNRSIGVSLDAFWSAPNLEMATREAQRNDKSGIFAGMAETALRVHQEHERQGEKGISAGVSVSDVLTRALRNYMVHTQAHIESGLTLLASVGSTAPFIGLFGTVWGIYHALLGLAGSTSVVLDKVAGPVGEALVMTAAGLFVAIPAVLAYKTIIEENSLFPGKK